MSATVRRDRARLAALARHRNPDDPELIDARRQLRAASLADRIREDVAKWPPLTDEQRDRLAALLRPADGGGRIAS